MQLEVVETMVRRLGDERITAFRLVTLHGSGRRTNLMDDAGARIREIECRLLASTPGPWRWVGYDLMHPRRNWALVKAAGALESNVSGSGEPPTVILGVAPVELYPNTYHWILPNRLDDLEFIEHAKEDVDFLLSELMKTRQLLAEMRTSARASASEPDAAADGRGM